MKWPAFLLVSAAVVANACDDAPPPRSPMSARDSAGVLIVEDLTPLSEEAPRWIATPPPSLVIGAGDDSGIQLYNVRSVHRLSNGRILVAQDSEISFFNASGGELSTVGGAGEGPGEYTRLMDVQPCGAGLVAEDVGAARVSILDDSGQFIARAETPAIDRGAVPPVVACFDGDLVYRVRTPSRSTASPTIQRDTYSLVRFEGDGTRDTVLQWPGVETFDGLRRPFGRTTLYAFSDSLVHLADSGDCQVRSYTHAGRLRRILRCNAEGPLVTDDDVAAARARYTEGVPQSILEREILPRLDAVPFPERKPTLSALRTDTFGNLWLRLHQSEEAEPPRWAVFNTDADFLGVARTPSSVQVHELDTTRVLGVWRDSLDVEYVHQYLMQRPGEDRGS